MTGDHHSPGPRSTRKQSTRWDTQDEAWDHARPRVATIADRILEMIEESPATCDEIEEQTGLAHQTASAAVNHLMKAGKIVATSKRPTRLGRMARVWAVPNRETFW
jgi:predicted Rossmann fold nucleotide-binding protein DprA/Smf involved in DNA uptake